MKYNYIKCGDCLVLMDELPNQSIDMILCDLPYGVTNNKRDIIIPFEPLWEQYERIIKDNGAIVLFGQGKFFIDLVNSNRKMFRYDLVWDKRLTTGFLNAKRMPLRRHEMIAVFYKKLPKYRPQFSEGNPLHSKGVNYINKELVNNNYGRFFNNSDERKGETQKYPTSILQFDKSHPASARHATEKPVKLLEYLIKTYTDEGDIIYDGCSGSGSTCIAAIRTGRKFIGHEKDRGIYDNCKMEIEKMNLNVAFLN